MEQKSNNQPLNTSRARRNKVSRQPKAAGKRLRELLQQIGLVRGELRDLFEVYGVVLASANRTGPRYVGGLGKSVLIPDVISTEDALDQALEICLQGQDELAEYIQRRKNDDDRPPGSPWYWYVFIREAQEKIGKLLKGEPVKSVGAPITTDQDGTYRVERDHFAEAIDGVDSRDLRLCALEDCGRVFFAKRVNQRHCTTKHGNVDRNRKLRLDRQAGFYSGVKHLTEKETSKN